jgi:hypothetical protein
MTTIAIPSNEILWKEVDAEYHAQEEARNTLLTALITDACKELAIADPSLIDRASFEARLKRWASNARRTVRPHTDLWHATTALLADDWRNARSIPRIGATILTSRLI